jgi:hypothetical protein
VAAKLMVAAYQLTLAAAWKMGGAAGDWITRGMARALKAPSHRQYISAAMNFPYFIFWTGAYGSYKQLRPLVPQCPMLFVYGTRKPFLFHSPQWADALNARAGSKALAFDTDHWPMVRQPHAFNQAVLQWLDDPRD